MQQILEKLLILQDRDRRIMKVKEQLARIQPERETFQTRSSSAQAGLDSVKTRIKQVETDRKNLELEVETKKGLISKYGLQQFQTKKNEEYRALATEITNCQAAISKLEDQQLELMEKNEGLQKEAVVAAREAAQLKAMSDAQLLELAAREKNLRDELATLESNRKDLTAGIDDPVLSKYERLLKFKGDSVVVGIEHGVCGGCYMRFPTQIIMTCKGGQEIVHCPNCGRILYFLPSMDMAIAESA